MLLIEAVYFPNLHQNMGFKKLEQVLCPSRDMWDWKMNQGCLCSLHVHRNCECNEQEDGCSQAAGDACLHVNWFSPARLQVQEILLTDCSLLAAA